MRRVNKQREPCITAGLEEGERSAGLGGSRVSGNVAAGTSVDHHSNMMVLETRR